MPAAPHRVQTDCFGRKFSPQRSQNTVFSRGQICRFVKASPAVGENLLSGGAEKVAKTAKKMRNRYPQAAVTAKDKRREGCDSVLQQSRSPTERQELARLGELVFYSGYDRSPNENEHSRPAMDKQSQGGQPTAIFPAILSINCHEYVNFSSESTVLLELTVHYCLPSRGTCRTAGRADGKNGPPQR